MGTCACAPAEPRAAFRADRRRRICGRRHLLPDPVHQGAGRRAASTPARCSASSPARTCWAASEERGGFNPLMLQRDGFFLSEQHIAIDREHARFSETDGDPLFDEAQTAGSCAARDPADAGRDPRRARADRRRSSRRLSELKLIEPIDIALELRRRRAPDTAGPVHRESRSAARSRRCRGTARCFAPVICSWPTSWRRRSNRFPDWRASVTPAGLVLDSAHRALSSCMKPSAITAMPMREATR